MDKILHPADIVVCQPVAKFKRLTPAPHRTRSSPSRRIPAWINEKSALCADALASCSDQFSVATRVLAKNAPAELHRPVTQRYVFPCSRSNTFGCRAEQRRSVGRDTVAPTAAEQLRQGHAG